MVLFDKYAESNADKPVGCQHSWILYTETILEIFLGVYDCARQNKQQINYGGYHTKASLE